MCKCAFTREVESHRPSYVVIWPFGGRWLDAIGETSNHTDH
eukprot:SAG31_NODE_42314_length_272_cov_0.601156_1_plen_40_part_01